MQPEISFAMRDISADYSLIVGKKKRVPILSASFCYAMLDWYNKAGYLGFYYMIPKFLKADSFWTICTGGLYTCMRVDEAKRLTTFPCGI